MTRRRRTAYVAGPMRGHENLNFPAFDAAAERLRAEGWSVVSPATRDREAGLDETVDFDPSLFDLAAAFRWDIAAILEADAIYMLRGWETSVGAGLEHRIATAIGMEIIYEDPADGADVNPNHVHAAVLGSVSVTK